MAANVEGFRDMANNSTDQIISNGNVSIYFNNIDDAYRFFTI